MLGGIGIQEIVIILIVGLLVFGAARLPKIARSLGLGIKEFKKTVKGLEDDDDEGPSNVKYVPPGQNYGQQQYPQYNYAQQNQNFQQGNSQGGSNPQGAPNPQGQYQPGPGQYPPGSTQQQTPPGAGPAGASPGTAPNQAAGGQMPNQQMPNPGSVKPDAGPSPASNGENKQA